MSACRVATLVLLAMLCAGCRLPSLDQMLDQSEPMDANRMLIGKVQGSGAASPMLKDEVIIEGEPPRLSWRPFGLSQAALA